MLRPPPQEDRTEAHVLFAWIAYALYWMLGHTHRRYGGTLTGRRVLEVLHGIELGTICLQTVEAVKLELDEVLGQQ